LLFGRSEGYGDSRKPLAMVNLLLCTADHFCYAVVGLWRAKSMRAGIPSGMFKENRPSIPLRKIGGTASADPRNTTSRSNPGRSSTSSDLPLLMEYLTGLAFRGWRIMQPGTTFDESLIAVRSLVSTASILACYAASSCILPEPLVWRCGSDSVWLLLCKR